MVILNMDEKFPRQLTFSYFFPVTYMKYEFERKIVMIFFFVLVIHGLQVTF